MVGLAYIVKRLCTVDTSKSYRLAALLFISRPIIFGKTFMSNDVIQASTVRVVQIWNRLLYLLACLLWTMFFI